MALALQGGGKFHEGVGVEMKIYLATEPIQQEDDSLTLQGGFRRMMSFFFLREKEGGYLSKYIVNGLTKNENIPGHRNL
jgi:hypothetical protein